MVMLDLCNDKDLAKLSEESVSFHSRYVCDESN